MMEITKPKTNWANNVQKVTKNYAVWRSTCLKYLVFPGNENADLTITSCEVMQRKLNVYALS